MTHNYRLLRKESYIGNGGGKKNRRTATVETAVAEVAKVAVCAGKGKVRTEAWRPCHRMSCQREKIVFELVICLACCHGTLECMHICLRTMQDSCQYQCCFRRCRRCRVHPRLARRHESQGGVSHVWARYAYADALESLSLESFAFRATVAGARCDVCTSKVSSATREPRRSSSRVSSVATVKNRHFEKCVIGVQVIM
jgi:hypothetical protein